MAVNEDTGIAAAEKAGIKLSSPDKVLYPGQGVTKGKLAAYYASVAPAMMPYIANRPLSLVRCPAGRAKQCFFQKHDTGGFAQGMDTIEIEEKDGQADSYFTLDDLGGLLAGVQMGVLEFHIWGSRRDAIEKPDRIVIDIDPDEGLDFGNVKSAACDIRDRLADLGLETFAMVTGGKGIHVIAPIIRRAEWPDVKAFALGFASQMAADEPDRFTATLSKRPAKANCSSTICATNGDRLPSRRTQPVPGRARRWLFRWAGTKSKRSTRPMVFPWKLLLRGRTIILGHAMRSYASRCPSR